MNLQNNNSSPQKLSEKIQNTGGPRLVGSHLHKHQQICLSFRNNNEEQKVPKKKKNDTNER